MFPSRPTGRVLLSLMLSLEACASMNGPPSASSPFLVTNPHDAKQYQALAREQESVLTKCAESRSCDRAHFTRALVALYENREVAVRHFRQVVAAAPKSRLASSSLFWLELLQDPRAESGQNGPLARATDRLVRDLLDREVMIHQLTKETTASLQALQEELTARDKKVEKLTNQLEALKQIDREMKDKSRLPKPSTKSLEPSPKDTLP